MAIHYSHSDAVAQKLYWTAYRLCLTHSLIYLTEKVLVYKFLKTTES